MKKPLGRIYIRIEEDFKAEIKELAKDRDLTISQMIRQFFKKELKEENRGRYNESSK